jgi:hypothetical protein
VAKEKGRNFVKGLNVFKLKAMFWLGTHQLAYSTFLKHKMDVI